MYRIEVSDEKEWEATSKQIMERDGYSYHGVPAPDGKRVIYTDGPVGESVEEADRDRVIRTDLAARPVDGRRMSSSRNWRGARGTGSCGLYTLVGTSRLTSEERKRIYEDEGCEPEELPEYRLPDAEAISRGFDTTLPPEGSEDMERLERKLVLHRSDDEDQELGPNGWPIT